jgi:hypothetical protein
MDLPLEDAIMTNHCCKMVSGRSITDLQRSGEDFGQNIAARGGLCKRRPLKPQIDISLEFFYCSVKDEMDVPCAIVSDTSGTARSNGVVEL